MKRSKAYRQDIQQAACAELPWEQLEQKEILIAGASGMIGTVLVDILAHRNLYCGQRIDITCAGRRERAARIRFADYWDFPFFSFQEMDIQQPMPQSYAPDYIVQAASNTHPIAYSTDPINTIMTNVVGTKNLLECVAKNKDCRLLLLSSCEIYGVYDGASGRMREDGCGYIDCNTLRAGYTESKRTAETLCNAYREKYGVDFVTARLSRIYGPTMRPDDSKAVSQFLLSAARGQSIELKSDGQQVFSYCYAVDAALALLYILLLAPPGRVYNVSDENCEISLLDLAKTIAEKGGVQLTRRSPSQVEQRGYSHSRYSLLDTSKLKQLGWRPHTDLQSGIEKTIAVLRDNCEE